MNCQSKRHYQRYSNRKSHLNFPKNAEIIIDKIAKIITAKILKKKIDETAGVISKAFEGISIVNAAVETPWGITQGILL